MGVVKIEGKSVTLDDAIIDAGIPAIKAALSVDFPDVENADIEIIGSRAPGVARSATVVKRGTGKGLARFSFQSGRSINSSGKSTKEYVQANAQRVVQELFRRAEANDRAGVVVELARTSCTCGSADPHPDLHFVMLAGGPFGSPEAALDALSDVVSQRADLLRNHQALYRKNELKPLSSKDITGATE